MRRGQYEGLRDAIRSDPGRAPDYGPARLHPKGGAVAVGARKPLIAFNVYLDGTDEAAGKEIARGVRESSGGLRGVQALALELGSGIQLSTNVIDLDATPPHALVGRVLEEAAARGLDVGAGELVGLIPAASVAQAAAVAGVTEPLDAAGVPTPAALEAAARALRLERLPADRVLEWHLS